MKKIYFSILSLAFLAILGSCSDDFGDMNTPSDASTEVEPKFFLSAMQQGVVANYQRNINLYPDLYSQYWANAVSGFESGRYEYVDGWIGNQWSEHYVEMLRRGNAIQDLYGDNENYTDIIAIKDIWMCYWWSRMTDTYGDIPYFGASELERVEYTSQEEIYDDMFKKLDNAVKNITGADGQYEYEAEYDLIFKGDLKKWKKFGNSLRLRFAMRISNADPVRAEKEVAAAINGPEGVMVSNADVAKVPLWNQGWYDYLHQMAWAWDNVRMSNTFSKYCYNQSEVGEDPRTPIWFTYDVKGKAKTKEEADFETYQGLVNGLNIIPSDASSEYATINLEGGYIDFVGSGSDSHYVPVMFYSEVKFLLAEAALRGWASGDAASLYKEGVKASMDYVGVASKTAEAYIAGLEDVNMMSSDEAKLKQIITQKWLANFPNGVEAWADFRRTDYPDISLPADGVSGSSTVAADTWVKRINYPDNEHRLNENNMPSALNSITSDRMDVRVWWDTANTKTKSGGLMSTNF